MRRTRAALGVAVTTLLLAEGAAHAVPAFEIDAATVQRRVESHAYNGITASYTLGDFVEDSDFETNSAGGIWEGYVESNTSPFDSIGAPGHGEATQSSTLNEDGVRFSSEIDFDAGSAFDGFDSPDDPEGSSYFVDEEWSGGGESRITLSFEIDELTPILFELSATDSGGPGNAFEAEVELLFFDPIFSLSGGPIVLLERDFADALGGESRAFNLGAGRYELAIDFRSIDFPNRDRTATLDFVLAVPEPGSGALLGLGLALVAARRRPEGRRSASDGG